MTSQSLSCANSNCTVSVVWRGVAAANDKLLEGSGCIVAQSGNAAVRCLAKSGSWGEQFFGGCASTCAVNTGVDSPFSLNPARRRAI